MYRLLLIIGLLFQCGMAAAAGPDIAGMLAYRETFVDNDEPLSGAAMLGRNDVWLTEVADGVLRFTNTEKNAALRYIDMPSVRFPFAGPDDRGTDGAEPFARVRVGETGDGGIGLLIGFPHGGEYMVFALGGEQRFIIASKVEGRLRRIHDDTSTAIRAGTFNDLVVRRMDGELHFEINGTEVFAAPADKLENAPVGLAVLGQGTFEAESVGVRAKPDLVDRIVSEAEKCYLPAAGDDDLIVLLGSLGGLALSTATVAGQDKITSTIGLEVADGDRPIHLIAVTLKPVIWRVEGAAQRVSHFTLVGDAAGVTGLPAQSVSFVSSDDCFSFFDEAEDKQARLAEIVVALALGRSVDHLGASYTPALFRLPEAEAKGLETVGAVGIDPDWHPALRQEIEHFYPGGVIAIDPADVVSQHPAEAYGVLPEAAGLAQLVADGVLERIDRRTYRIVKPMARFPAGLAGLRITYELPHDIPVPAGGPKNPRIMQLPAPEAPETPAQ